MPPVFVGKSIISHDAGRSPDANHRRCSKVYIRNCFCCTGLLLLISVEVNAYQPVSGGVAYAVIRKLVSPLVGLFDADGSSVIFLPFIDRWAFLARFERDGRRPATLNKFDT